MLQPKQKGNLISKNEGKMQLYTRVLVCKIDFKASNNWFCVYSNLFLHNLYFGEKSQNMNRIFITQNETNSLIVNDKKNQQLERKHKHFSYKYVWIKNYLKSNVKSSHLLLSCHKMNPRTYLTY